MNNRIKKLRTSLGLTQQKFADKLGVKGNTISQYESGRNAPVDSVISLICREFNVSETWLRTGEGEMFVELPRNEALAAQIQQLLQGGTDGFRERLVSLLLRLSPEQWEALEGYLIELVPPAPPPAVPDTDGQERAEPGIASQLAELRRQNQEIVRQNKKLAAKIAAMEEEDAKMDAVAELSAWSSASAGTLSPAQKAKK